jgi:hypothetical protein
MAKKELFTCFENDSYELGLGYVALLEREN